MKISTFCTSMLLFLAFACNSSKSTTTVEDCYADRETTATIENQTGKILKISDELLLIAVDNSEQNTRYMPCNLEAGYKIDNKSITFSGMVKQIFPNERWPGTPFVITKCAD